MFTLIKSKKEVKVNAVKVSVAVRYNDEDMAFDAPLRNGNKWEATILLNERKVKDWPIGSTLSFYMKIADEGTYTLLDENGNKIKTIKNGYVPNELLPGDFGDYLELKIDRKGNITNWDKKANLSDFI